MLLGCSKDGCMAATNMAAPFLGCISRREAADWLQPGFEAVHDLFREGIKKSPSPGGEGSLTQYLGLIIKTCA